MNLFCWVFCLDLFPNKYLLWHQVLFSGREREMVVCLCVSRRQCSSFTGFFSTASTIYSSKPWLVHWAVSSLWTVYYWLETFVGKNSMADHEIRHSCSIPETQGPVLDARLGILWAYRTTSYISVNYIRFRISIMRCCAARCDPSSAARIIFRRAA